MNFNISKLNDDLRKGVFEVKDILGIVMDENGYELHAEQSENFKVTLNGKSITIYYTALSEFYRGLKTVKQNLSKKLSVFEIEEKNSFKDLGIMVDCSRNAVKSVEGVKDIIRHLALMGYNQLMLYTEDTYEIEGEPFFGYRRGRYTVREFNEIDDYAAEFGIEMVPCIQTLAHLNAIFRWPVYNDIHDIDDIMFAGEEKTYELIDKMFASMKKSLKSNKINIGMDEAHKLGKGKYLDKNGLVPPTEILLKHLNRVVEIAKKYGYTPMMWADMFFRIANGGEYYAADGTTVDVSGLIPDGLELIYWDYYHEEKEHYDKMITAHEAMGAEVIFAGGAWTWVGFTPANKYSLATSDAAMRSMIEKGLKRAFFTMWGDNGAECSFYAVLPSLMFIAERAYGNEEYKDALHALTNIDFDKFMAIDINNVLDEYADVKVYNPSKYMLYSNCFAGLFDYLVREGDSAIYQKHVKTLNAVEKSAGRYSYLFATQRALAEVLAIKYELGVKTRNAYNTKDTKAIKTLLKGSYYPLIKRLEEFYECFEYQWFKENKPQGFEVQDTRIGGVIKSVEHCAKRLEAYMQGKVTSIPELEEKMLDFTNSNGMKGAIAFNNYKGSYSVTE